jgi:TRAP-type C4-dicarboxylate transport system substrate-binding protein
MKRQALVVCCVLALVILLTQTGPSTAQAQEFKLTYSNFFPPTHIQSILAEQWSKEVEKRTNGKVKVEYFPGQTLSKANQCYDGVVQGISDVGFSVLGYTRGRFPVMSAVDLPLGYTSGKAATTVINAVYQKFQPKELMDTQVMYLHAHGPGLIHTKDKAVRKLEDMKGLKFRSHGTSADTVTALGGTPVPKPMPETYEMLQKGVVDGAAYPLEACKGWKLGEVTKFCTANFTAAYTTSFFVVMNKDKWKAFPPDIQKTIEAINAEWVEKHADAWDESDLEGLRYFLGQGGQVIGLDGKEAARWKTAVVPVIEAYAKELDGKGLDGKAVVAFIDTTLAEMK